MTDVVVTRLIAASPTTVFSFFTDAERWASWQGVDAEIDARPGGVLQIGMPGGQVASGRFVEVIPDQRLVFTWGWAGEAPPVPPGSTTVVIELKADEAGTLLRLTHSALTPPPIAEHHREGWERYLERLRVRAEGGDPGPDSPEPGSKPQLDELDSALSGRPRRPLVPPASPPRCLTPVEARPGARRSAPQLLQPLQRLLGRFAQQEPDEPAIGSGDWETREALASRSLDESAEPGAWPDGARRFRHRDSDRKIVVASERTLPEPADHDASRVDDEAGLPAGVADAALHRLQRFVEPTSGDVGACVGGSACRAAVLALEWKTTGGTPVSLPGDVVVDGAIAECFEPRRGSWAHVSLVAVAVDDHRAAQVESARPSALPRTAPPTASAIAIGRPRPSSRPAR